MSIPTTIVQYVANCLNNELLRTTYDIFLTNIGMFWTNIVVFEIETVILRQCVNMFYTNLDVFWKNTEGREDSFTKSKN